MIFFASIFYYCIGCPPFLADLFHDKEMAVLSINLYQALTVFFVNKC